MQCLQGIKVLLITSLILWVTSVQADNLNPLDATPFKIPKTLKDIDENYRTKWSRLSGFEPSGLHWNQFVMVYTNIGDKTYRKNFFEYIKVLEADEEDEDYDANYQMYPIGTVILKENYFAKGGKPGTPSTLTIMIKREANFDPTGGDWQYYESNVDGQLIMSGKGGDAAINQRCAACHRNIAERDYVFSTFFRGSLK